MADLEFDALREAVENDTFLPEFAEIRKRARRHRRWRRVVNLTRILGVIAIATPGLAIADVVFTHIYRPAEIRIAAGPNDGGTGTEPGPASAVSVAQNVVTSEVVAVDGIDSAHVYALVDVCVNQACNLQLSQVNPVTSDPMPLSIGLIRSNPRQGLTGTRLVLSNETTAYVSGVPTNSLRQQVTITIAAAPGKVASPRRPVQITAFGAIGAVTGGFGPLATIPSQPSVSAPVLVSSVRGWWVTGLMPSGELAISVSHDDGRTWTTHPTGVKPLAATVDGPATTAYATDDGTNMFILARTATGLKLVFSSDAGVTWHQVSADVPWPAASSFNIVVTEDGELIASFTNGSKTTYLASVDYGATFGLMDGPPSGTGNIVQVGGELITIGAHPQVSTDGVNWENALIQTVAPD